MVSNLFCKEHQNFVDEIINLGLVYDLVHHASALGETGSGVSVTVQLFGYHFSVKGFDVENLLMRERGIEDT